jgi:hypothetical protein
MRALGIQHVLDNNMPLPLAAAALRPLMFMHQQSVATMA